MCEGQRMKRKLFDAFYRKEDWAVKEVYLRYSRLLKHVSYQIVGDNDLSDGVVSDTFIRVLNKGKIDDEKSFIAYMCQVARNLSIDIVKERNKYDSLPEDFVGVEEKSDDDCLAHTQALLISGSKHNLIAHIHIRQSLTDSLHGVALRVGKERLDIASLFELGLVIRTGCGGQCQSG